MEQHRVKLSPNPMEKAGIFSKLTFTWLLPFFVKGYKRPIVKEDLYRTMKEDASEGLGNILSKNWDKEVLAANLACRKPSYVRALFKTFGLSYGLIGLLALVEECFLKIGQPLCLGGLINYFSQTGGHSDPYTGLLYALGVTVGYLLYISIHHPFFWSIQRTGMKIRIASCSLIYRKALRLSNAALGQTTVGQMINLLSNDVNRFDISAIFLHYVWIGPLQTVIVTFILWHELTSVACISGVIVIVLFVPIQSCMSHVFAKLRLAMANQTDERIRIINEIVNAMRVIKMYVWEKPFTTIVKESRQKEISTIMKTNYYRAVNMSLFFTSSKIVVFLSLVVYVLTGNVLTAEKVYVTYSLINNIRMTMTLYFPRGIAMASETLISCNRIQEFLEMDEKKTSNRIERTNLKPKPQDCFLETIDLCAQWKKGKYCDLTNISFRLEAGQLLAVVGAVGSGKSSLLQALLSEMPSTQGSLKIGGKLAYCSQEPWFFSGTVKQNILFGLPFNANKYKEVIIACALERDLEILPEGDETMVGERGVALSGGQKARINLARAVYFDADIYLLDDPLSAVDAHVGNQLFDQCIMKLLRYKVRVLVTHQLQFIKTANQILVLRNGYVKAQGTYYLLTEQGINFADLTHESESKSPEDESSILSENDTQELEKVKVNIDSEGFEVENSRKENVMDERSKEGADVTEEKGENGTFCPNKINNSVAKERMERRVSIASFQESLKENDFSREKSFRKSNGKNTLPLNSDKSVSSSRNSTSDMPPSLNKGEGYEESMSTSSVSFRVYGEYFLSGGGIGNLLFLVLLCIFTQTLFTGCDYWLSYWTNVEQIFAKAVYNVSYRQNFTIDESNFDESFGELDRESYIYIYTGMVVGLFVSSMIRTIMFFIICMNASTYLHNRMFTSIIEAPIAFFDTHPIGSILNRFSKDIGQIDDLLPPTFYDFLEIFLNCVGAIVIVSYINIWTLLPTIFLGFVFYLLRKFYLSSARDIKRLEGITRSPVFSHLSTSLYGLSTIRALNAEETLIKEFDNHQDLHSSAWFLFLCTTRSFGLWLDVLASSYVSIVTFSFLGKSDVMGGDVGLAISSAMMFSSMFQWGVHQSAEVENQMTSVERVVEYSKIEPETKIHDQKKEKHDWPSKGKLTFQNVYLYFNYDDPPVLKNVSFIVEAGQKIAIVGRTGAGKTSLLTCLFRLTQPEGRILVDDVDTDSVQLSDLRRSISIIPQNPTLFNRSVRYNLDPFSTYSDEQIWSALEEVQLKKLVHGMNGGLSSIISEGGTNLSVGQRQLICLARAILKPNKIFVMDEATANVDQQTTCNIQEVIRTRLTHSTVLTIAHRLNTIMDSDKVLVMDAGTVMEFDAPHKLLLDDSSMFSSLIRRTGSIEEKALKKIAKEAYYKEHGCRGQNKSD